MWVRITYQNTVAHIVCDITIPPEQEKESAYEDSKKIVEDQCGPMSDEEDNEMETEVPAHLDSMEPTLIDRKDLDDFCRELKLTKEKSQFLDSRLKQWDLLQEDTRKSFLKYREN